MKDIWGKAKAETSNAAKDELCQPVYMATYRFMLPDAQDGKPPQIVQYTAEVIAPDTYKVQSVVKRTYHPFPKDRPEVETFAGSSQPLITLKPNRYKYREALSLLRGVEARRKEEGLVPIPPTLLDLHNHYTNYIDRPLRPCSEQELPAVRQDRKLIA